MTPLMKKVTLDTNADVFGEANNLYVEVINDDTNEIAIQTPEFTEILLESNPTGIYVAEVLFSTEGRFTIRIKHNALTQTGETRISISENGSYNDIEEKIDAISDTIENTNDSISFA